MAWHATGNSISMAEHDFGIKLPMLIKGVTFAGTDSVQMAIKAKADAEPIITKTFGDVTENTVYIELTEAESELLPVGSYVYVLDWYQDGVFMCNILAVYVPLIVPVLVLLYLRYWRLICQTSKS